MPTSASSRFSQHARRLFVRAGETITLDEHSLPLFPDQYTGNLQQAPWEAWSDVPCLVVLGEPRLGKSQEFEFQDRALREQAQISYCLSLSDYGPGSSVSDFVDRMEWDNWISDPTATLTLFLDSLDEGRSEFAQILPALILDLQKLPTARLRVRLSCRARDWRQVSDKEKLERLFPAIVDERGKTIDRLQVIELVPLDWNSIRMLAAERFNPPDDFLRAILEKRLAHLCSLPLLLDQLLTRFALDGALAVSMQDIYKSSVERLLAEHNRRRGETLHAVSSVRSRLETARKIAVLSILSGRSRFGIPDRDTLEVTDLDGTLADADKRLVSETLDTALFSHESNGKFRFTHRSWGEFLAGEYLAERVRQGFRLGELMALLVAPNGRVPGPLRVTAAWVASFEPKFARELLRLDHLCLLQGDPSVLDRQLREQLIQTLAERYKNWDWQNEVDHFTELARGCDTTMLTTLLERRNSMAVRGLAVDLISEANNSNALEHLKEITLDSTESYDLRCFCARRVLRKGTNAQKMALKRLLTVPQSNDPEDELAGLILDALFPDHLQLNEALNALHVPNNPNHIGNYYVFWHHSLTQRVRNEQLEQCVDHLLDLLQAKPAEDWAFNERIIPELYSKLLAT